MTEQNLIIEVQRKTKETDIQLRLNVRGNQQIEIDTGVGFFDHMLTALASHARWDLSLEVKGDLEVDDHHSVEDIAICLGNALQQSWRKLPNMQRYGQRLLPMDEALILCAVDLSGRAYYVGQLNFTREYLGGVSTEMFEHFFNTLASAAGMTLHIKPEYFRNNHHLAEGCFKALAYALKEALSDSQGEVSTKGVL
ncbi:MAG: imidazoleglycerol-phosphate dehydratase HisB [Kangiellaceae bacterium]|nr:imidazoleglycerol-phosphate dehydratase HisB [Kangiellaceae bacterium]MCW8997813.1 imidazoleglycerol-phosphate dehydratase HisB [Kangiellaceae bacterium]MCW9015619.1 imidazoleglycerol-phosphate dehydratase HisB [Kangiellaceae bacterium]